MTNKRHWAIGPFCHPSSLFSAMLAVSVGFAGLTVIAPDTCQAESLYKAGIAYQTAEPYTPRSWFTVARPRNIGDLVTVNINENQTTIGQNTVTLNKQHTVTENSTSIINNVLNTIFRRPQGSTIFPTVDGLENQDQQRMRLQNQKVYNYKDSITCQVVQILPNGYLVIQGRRSMLASKDSQDLIVSGIVNPYFLNAKNQINSTQVANLQLNVIGRGPTERATGDGVISKYLQFVN